MDLEPAPEYFTHRSTMAGRIATASMPSAGAARPEVCPACRRLLPLRPLRDDEPAIHWQCAACRWAVSGALLRDATPRLAHRLELDDFHFRAARAIGIPDTVRQLIREFAACREPAQTTDERRQSPRAQRQLEVSLVRLDDGWLPRGLPEPGIVVDLASHGLGMVSPVGEKGSFVLIQALASAGRVQLLGQLVWSKELVPGYYNVGVKFVLRLGRRPAASL